MSKWYVICTRKGWEKKVEAALLAKGLESFCPLVRTKRQWSDRMKWVAAPLFGSQVFVRIKTEQRPAVRLTPGVKNLVHENGKPVTVRKKEIELLRQLLAGNHPVRVFALTESLGFLESNGANEEEMHRAIESTLKKTKIVIGGSRYEIRATVAKPEPIPVPAANAIQ